MVSEILPFIIEKRAQRYMFQMVLPNNLAKKFYLGSKKKAKGVWYASKIVHIPVKRTKEVKGKTNNNPKTAPTTN